MRHVAGADIPREHLGPRNLRGAVDAIFEDIIAAVPIRPCEQLLLEQRCKGLAAKGCEVDRNTADNARP
jgi:hypothetical protein